MILSKEDLKKLNEAAKPLLEFINEHGHPHITCIVTLDSVEILECLALVKNSEFVKD